MIRVSHPTWPVRLAALFLMFVGSVALWNAVRVYGRPVASILVDPDATVSSSGRSLEDPHPEVRFPAGIIEIDGEDLTQPPLGAYRAEAFDRAVERASNLSRP